VQLRIVVRCFASPRNDDGELKKGRIIDPALCLWFFPRKAHAAFISPALGHELALSSAPGAGTDLADLSQRPPSASKVSRDEPGFVPKGNDWRWISGKMF
jgi:hypothetical protein